MSETWTVDDVLDQTVKSLALSDEAFRELPPTEAVRVVKAATQRFVRGNPRAWWMALKVGHDKINVDAEGFAYLDHFWPAHEEHAYFVPENGTKTLRVFEATLAAVKAVLGESSFFEYYVVGRANDWLLTENDHNELFIAKP